MIVYILVVDIPYEGTDILGVFDSKDKSNKALLNIGDWYERRPKDPVTKDNWNKLTELELKLKAEYKSYHESFPYDFCRSNEVEPDDYFIIEHEVF